MTRRLCLVTGASSGIGAAFARLYAARGCDVAVTARRADRLDALADELRARSGVEAIALPADLADPGAPGRLIEALAERGRSVDVLVNNAGYGLRGDFQARAWADQQAFLQVMVTAVAELSHRALPGMAQRGYGRILNVASLLGMVPAMPGNGLYSAAKAFVVKFSEGLHLETEGTGVHVVAVCPGLTRSEFHDEPALRAAVAAAPDWAWTSAEAVAEAAYAAAEANRPIMVVGAPNRAAGALLRLLPETWGMRIMAAQARR